MYRVASDDAEEMTRRVLIYNMEMDNRGIAVEYGLRGIKSR